MTDDHQHLICPGCGEAVKAHWRFCPACETRLQELVCPACGMPVKESWKRCPECEFLLICSQCGRRINQKTGGCPYCEVHPSTAGDDPDLFRDAVCGMEMVYVPGGTFSMGDTASVGLENESPVHEVTLAGFYMARFTVTQSQWAKLVPENPSRLPGDHLPVEQITWAQADHFAQMLTQAHQGRHHFDLPTEAQWEYAARSGGKLELYAGGSDIDTLAWYEENSQGRPHAVGGKTPNGLGLFDMSGNVWEWCRDTYLEDAYSRYTASGLFLETGVRDRVIRGGSWHLDAWSARCSRRIGFDADFMGPALGFRLIMQPVP